MSNQNQYTVSAMIDWDKAAFHFLSMTPPSAIYLLRGHLGAGKTTFVQSAGRYLQVEDRITSPTFNLFNEYDGFYHQKPVKMFHADCYRMNAEDTLPELDFFDLTTLPFFAFIEWPGSEWTNWGIPAYRLDIETPDKSSNTRILNFYESDYE